MDSTTEPIPPVNDAPSASEVLDCYWESWQDERTMGDTMRDIMKPVLGKMLGFRPARMYGEQRLIGF